MTTYSDTSPTAKTIRCAACERLNPIDRKFCGDCGGKLFEACLKCAASNAVDETFCGGCGTNLADSLKDCVASIEKKLELAVRMEREGRFYDASSMLREITSNGDGRLERYQENAIKLLQQLEARKERRMQETRHFESEARKAHDEKQYAKAHQALNSIPVALRSKEIESLCKEVEGLHNEVRSLYAEIRSDLKAKSFDGLLDKVQRYCDLQPHHKEVQQLGEKLRKQEALTLSSQANKLAVLAHKKIAAGQYREAANAVEKIEPRFREGKIAHVCRQAIEANWYLTQLEREPNVGPTLLKIAQRWQKMKSDDQRAAKHVAAISEKIAAEPSDLRFQRSPWGAPPKKNDGEYSAKHWTGIARAQAVDEDVAATLEANPGQFFCAYGLALQGVGEGRFKHNLVPNKNSWGRFLTKKKVSNVWGMDVGSTSIKAIELTKLPNDDGLEITNSLHLPLNKPLFDCRDDDEQTESIKAALEEFMEAADTQKPVLAVGFSGHLALPRFFDLPPIKSKKTSLDETVRFEMKHQIPLSLDDAVYDYFAWDLSGRGFEEKQSITAVAARREDAENWLKPFVDAGCRVSLLQCDAFAIYNALYYEFLAGKDTDKVVAVLDVGGDVSNIVIAEKNFVWTRSMFLGTKRFSNALVRELKLTKQQTQQLRHDPSKAKWMHRVDETLQPEFVDLIEDFERTIRGYPKKTGAPVELLLGIGGGFCQFGLLQSILNYNS